MSGLNFIKIWFRFSSLPDFSNNQDLRGKR
jgi:hypothetical protein